jgi:hypothetical protein
MKNVDFTGENNPMFGIPPPFKNSLYECKELNHQVRSNWERNFCLKLVKSNIQYMYEPETFKYFIDNKKVSYTPDLKIRDLFIEIKGYLKEDNARKILEFSKHHKLIVISSSRNLKILAGMNLKVLDYNEVIKENFDIKSVFNSN